MENIEKKSLIRAERRIEDLKKFYKHLSAYILLNLFFAFVWNFTFKIFGNFIVSNQFDGAEARYIPIWLIWGVFLTVHAIIIFGFPNAFGRDWEEKKIKEYMGD